MTRYQETKKAVIVGAITNVFLGFLKIIVGYVGHSQALIVDGIHTLSDLLTDFLVWFASFYGNQEADRDHPYGHGRIETAATTGLAIFLIIVGLGIVADVALTRLGIHSGALKPHPYVLAAIFISLIGKEGLYHYTIRVANRVNSDLLRANAWHHRSDAGSTLAVLIGVIGALLGFVYLDAVAALVVGLMIAHMGYKIAWPGLQELVDTAVDHKTFREIEGIIEKVSGVKALHQLRTRSIRGEIVIDVHVLVSPRISVSEGHHIAQHVHLALMNEMKNINDVTVHIDPEDDEIANPCIGLPDKASLLKACKPIFASLVGGQEIKDIVAHYLDGKIELRIMLPLSLLDQGNDPRTLHKAYAEKLKKVTGIGLIQLGFE